MVGGNMVEGYMADEYIVEGHMVQDRIVAGQMVWEHIVEGIWCRIMWWLSI